MTDRIQRELELNALPEAVWQAVTDPDWLADQLPMWAGRCASREGSADDTTIAFLLAPREPCPNDRPR